MEAFGSLDLEFSKCWLSNIAFAVILSSLHYFHPWHDSKIVGNALLSLLCPSQHYPCPTTTYVPPLRKKGKWRQDSCIFIALNIAKMISDWSKPLDRAVRDIHWRLLTDGNTFPVWYREGSPEVVSSFLSLRRPLTNLYTWALGCCSYIIRNISVLIFIDPLLMFGTVFPYQ